MLTPDRQRHDREQAEVAKDALMHAMRGDGVAVEVAVKNLTLSGVSQIRKALPILLAALEGETGDRIEQMAEVSNA